MKEIRRLLHFPKIQLAGFLLLILISSFLFHPNVLIVITFAIALCATVVADFVFLRIRKVELFLPSAAIVSGLIISLLVAPNVPWFEIVAIGILAMASKQILRIRNGHIFNPAAFGLFFGSLLFGRTVSWWGVSWQEFRIQNLELIIGATILILPFLISGLKMRRYFTIFVFIITYIILTSRLVFDPTVIFFALVILPEPMTTPAKPKEQILFGLFIAATSILNSRFSILNSIPDVLIFSLLLGNVIYFTYNNFMRKAVRKNEQ